MRWREEGESERVEENREESRPGRWAGAGESEIAAPEEMRARENAPEISKTPRRKTARKASQKARGTNRFQWPPRIWETRRRQTGRAVAARYAPPSATTAAASANTSATGRTRGGRIE